MALIERLTTLEGNVQPVGYQQLNAATIASNATSLTIPAGANLAFLQAEVADVRFLDNGGAPTSSIGMLLKAGLNPQKYVGDLTKLQFIAGATNAALDVSYYFSG